MDDAGDTFKADVAALQFLVDAGLDVIIEATPQNRLAPPEPAPPPAAPAMREEAPRQRLVTEPPRRPEPADSDRQAAETAAQIAPACNSLDELRAALEGFHGLAIRETATQLVFADGNPEAEIMIVGEAPGREEDRIGKPFVGESGKLLDRMLAAIGLDRTTVYITNTVLWRPPGNRKPNPSETAAMLPFLIRHIELVQPKAMMLAGGAALSALYGMEARITRERGRWRDYEASFGTVPLLPLYHPAYLLRQPSLKREAWADLRAFRTKCGELGLI
ncbi:MAG: uracil-DNA glycosylase [Minwuia sp.]|uniref:uracil-DNA glycosylase n=1 Tax=Minwuia sp. TaxID=2493630 RepID=UPI003A898E92